MSEPYLSPNCKKKSLGPPLKSSHSKEVVSSNPPQKLRLGQSKHSFGTAEPTCNMITSITLSIEEWSSFHASIQDSCAEDEDLSNKVAQLHNVAIILKTPEKVSILSF
jgi:hypothetical protein